MSITVEWDNPQKTILRQTFVGSWTIDEFIVARDQMLQLQDPIDYKFDILIDFRQSASLPSNFLSKMPLPAPKSSHLHKIVIVGTNTLMQVLFKVISTALPAIASRITLVNNLEEAYALLNATDSPPTDK